MNDRLTKYSRDLRKNMTKEERQLWYDFLKPLPLNFRKQHIIDDKYIVDFYCRSENMVIELDGSQHYDDSEMQRDAERDLYLEKKGIKVLRYSNYDINTRFRNVCEDILAYINKEK